MVGLKVSVQVLSSAVTVKVRPVRPAGSRWRVRAWRMQALPARWGWVLPW
ncbi:hypothetical protein [Micromonospora maris]|nr:hypothetical protein OG712_14185 [Micromonospora maris]